MTRFTLEDLTVLLRECAGEDETTGLDGDILDTAFEDLGYDSLALFNTIGRIERERSVALPDDVVVNAKTPRQLLDEINGCLGESA
ncbi:acyl carrier protein [Amycolatopsis sp. WGS_07]|uniref:acyl carrier protein n=1 Tax=Amycolatopsis sp. WGS_07 TaxID=3076764 RepID=UPI00387360E1